MKKEIRKFLIVALVATISINTFFSDLSFNGEPVVCKAEAAGESIFVYEIIAAILALLGISVTDVAGTSNIDSATMRAVVNDFKEYVSHSKYSFLVNTLFALGATGTITITNDIVSAVRDWVKSKDGVSIDSGAVVTGSLPVYSSDNLKYYSDFSGNLGIFFGDDAGTSGHSYVLNLSVAGGAVAPYVVHCAKEEYNYIPGLVAYGLISKEPFTASVAFGAWNHGGFNYSEVVKMLADYDSPNKSEVSPGSAYGYYYLEWTIPESYFTGFDGVNTYISDQFNVLGEYPYFKDYLASIAGSKPVISPAILSLGGSLTESINAIQGKTLASSDLKAIVDAFNHAIDTARTEEGALPDDIRAIVSAAVAQVVTAIESSSQGGVTDETVTSGISGIIEILKEVASSVLGIKSLPTLADIESLFSSKRIEEDLIHIFPKVIVPTLQEVFPSSDFLRDLAIEIFPSKTLVEDWISVFPKKDYWEKLINIFPSITIEDIKDAVVTFPKAIADLGLTLTDALNPAISKPWIESLPDSIADALSDVWANVTINIPEISIPNYLEILQDILTAIQAIPKFFVLDIPAIKAATDEALDGVGDHTGLTPVLATFEGLHFADNYEYPKIVINTPQIIRQFYDEPQIVLLDFKDYAEYMMWARLIFRVTLWFAFLLWAVREFKVSYHIA